MSFAVKGSAAVFRFPNRREKISDRSGLEHFSRRDEFDLGEAESILRSWDPKPMVAVPAGRSFSRSDSSHFTLAAGCEIKCCVSIVIFPLSPFDDFFQLIFAENKIFRFSLEGHRIVSELQDPPCFRDSGRRTFDRFAEFRQRNKWRCPLRKPFCFVEFWGADAKKTHPAGSELADVRRGANQRPDGFRKKVYSGNWNFLCLSNILVKEIRGEEEENLASIFIYGRHGTIITFLRPIKNPKVSIFIDGSKFILRKEIFADFCNSCFQVNHMVPSLYNISLHYPQISNGQYGLHKFYFFLRS